MSSKIQFDTAFTKKWIYLERMLLGIILFSLPLIPKITAVLIIIFTCLSLLRFRVAFFKRLLISKELLLYMLLYVLLTIGIFYSSNFNNGISKIQTQVSFILIPLILGGRRFRLWEKVFYIRMFVWGTFLSVVICLLNATRRLYLSNSLYTVDAFGKRHNIFTYNEFSSFMDLHPSYFALYVGLALLLLLFDSTSLICKPKLWKVGLTLGFMAALLLISSKGGLISFLIAFTIVSVYKLISAKSKKTNYLYMVLILVVLAFTAQKSGFYNRAIKGLTSFSESYGRGQAVYESTSIRYYLWKLSLKTAKNSLLLGHGTGSVQNELNDQCLQHYYFSTCELLRNKNSHNQYLNFLVSNGLLFLLLFVLAIVISIIKSIRINNIFLLTFLTFISVNLFFESLLQRERGVIYFMLFIVVFLKKSPPALRSAKSFENHKAKIAG